MVPEQEDTRLDEFLVDGNQLLRHGKAIAAFPTAIAEIARLGEMVFVVLTTHDHLDDPVFAGTNLWALDLAGNVLWKARNLNDNPDQFDPLHPRSYSRLVIFDRSDPKLRCDTGERGPSIRRVDTGGYVTTYPRINWKDYAQAMREVEAGQKAIRDSIFVWSRKFAPVSPEYPLLPGERESLGL